MERITGWGPASRRRVGFGPISRPGAGPAGNPDTGSETASGVRFQRCRRSVDSANRSPQIRRRNSFRKIAVTSSSRTTSYSQGKKRDPTILIRFFLWVPPRRGQVSALASSSAFWWSHGFGSLEKGSGRSLNRSLGPQEPAIGVSEGISSWGKKKDPAERAAGAYACENT